MEKCYRIGTQWGHRVRRRASVSFFVFSVRWLASWCECVKMHIIWYALNKRPLWQLCQAPLYGSDGCLLHSYCKSVNSSWWLVWCKSCVALQSAARTYPPWAPFSVFSGFHICFLDLIEELMFFLSCFVSERYSRVKERLAWKEGFSIKFDGRTKGKEGCGWKKKGGTE